MALRFFADHCVSNLIIQSLAAAGHEVLRPKDHLHAYMEDYRGRLITVDAWRVRVRQ